MIIINEPSIVVGKIYSSVNFGDFIVQDIHSIEQGSYIKSYTIKFLETGYTQVYPQTAIRNGIVKDYMKPYIFGVGYLGSFGGKRTDRSKKVLDLWRGMLGRCYSTTNASYPSYGALGVSVCERWHCFDVFEKDIETLKGYDKSLFDAGLLELDKDCLQKDILKENKVYSPETCLFLSSQENMQLAMNEKMRKLIALNPKGDEIVIHNIAQFAYENDMSPMQIYGIFNKEGNYGVKGWVFGEFGIDSFEELVVKQKEHIKLRNKKVIAINNEGSQSYNSISECSRELKISRNKIRSSYEQNIVYKGYSFNLV